LALVSEDMVQRSQFYLTFQPTPHLDKKHTVFGKLVGGEDVLDALEKLPRKDGTERPLKPVRITEVVMWVKLFSTSVIPSRSFFRYQDPFEEYRSRLAKKLAKQAEAQEKKAPEKKDGDDINWFGVRVGTNSAAFGTGSVSGGVGKYLNNSGGFKRPKGDDDAQAGAQEENRKKRKLGFCDFDAW
jgi:peptidyl-prolyl cis-trans isomerase-like 2